jgi:KEOPS complex subunit Cgi121
MSHRIAGARGKITDPESILHKAQEWTKAHGGDVLLADALTVFGRDHLESAALHAERARETGATVAHSLGLEALRYLAGERQVRDAIRIAGIHPGTERIAIVLFGDADIETLIASLGWTRDDEVLEADGKDLALLGLGATALATVSPDRVADLALERTALLDVEK